MTLLIAAQNIAQSIADRGDEIEAARRLPADIAHSLSHAGLIRMLVPQALGGGEVSPWEAVEAIETVAESNAATGWCTMIAGTTGLVAAYLPKEDAREVYGAEDAYTGGVFAPQGKAVVAGDTYRVNGQWQWTSGGHNCQWLMGGCVIIEDGEMKRLPNGAPDSRMVLFPQESVELIDTWYAAGMSGTGSGDMAVHDLVVPARRSVSLVMDRPWADGPLYRFPLFGLLSLGIAGVALGNAKGAMRELKDLALAKRRRDSRRTVAETGHGQTAMAQAHAKWRSARAYLHDVTDEAWETAQAGDPLPIETRAEIRLAAAHATRTCADITRDMYDLGGGTSVYLTSPLQRRFRDGHVATQHMMVAHSTFDIAGRALYGLEVDPTFL
ncbi:MAG: acyl-CoA dehydrogenase family protein [Alphaproteobacteria bacterium]